MSQRQDKKIRQYYRKDIQEEMKREAKSRMDKLIPQLRKTIKKPPRFFPKFLWNKIATLFINLD